MGRQLGKQFLTRVALVVAMFAALIGFVLIHTVWEANRVELDNEKKAVETLIQTQMDQIAIMADDNGRWDDATEAVYKGSDPGFAWDAWGTNTAENRYYATAAVISPDGKTKLTYHLGKLVNRDIAGELGKSYDVLAERANTEREGVAGLVQLQGQIAAVGIANIVPVSRALSSAVPSDGPSKIVFIQPISKELIASLGDGIMIGDLRFDADSEAPATQTLRDVTGKVITKLTWTPDRPGDAALHRALPVIAVGFFLYLLMVALLVSKGFNALSELGQLALVDSLSTLPNRRSLKRKLEEHMQKGDRIALALLDLDGFKAINDNFGHPVGDHLIREVADLLRQHVSPDELVARLGGDEFAIILSGWDADTRIEQVAGRIIARFAQPFRIEDRTLAVGVSFGLVAANSSTLGVGEAMRRADVALYAAKRSGKMRFQWFNERLDLIQTKSSVIESELREALEQNQFSIVYQPQIFASDKSIASAEALLRWTHPTRGDVPPSEFIPIADQTGLIDKIGLWVIERACTDALEWHNQMVTINISGAQLRNPDFSRQVSQTVNKVGFPTARLQFEVTEGWLVREPQAARHVLEDLRALGISIVLDDYGSGFASAGFLKSFPFTGVKIAGSLVSESEVSESARTIIGAAVAVARALNLKISAASVETEAQSELMRIAGCQELQGWHISEAVNAHEMSEQIRVSAEMNPRPPQLWTM